MKTLSFLMRIKSTSLLTCAMFFYWSAASAQVVQPMRFSLQPSGEDAHKTLTVQNTNDSSLTIEVAASSIGIDDDGNEILAPADDEFVIFPPTAIIQPGRLQAIRVQYVGEPDIQASQSYRVSIRQVPVDLSGLDQNAVAIAVNFNTLAHVIPSGAEALPVVERIEEDRSGDVWNITIKNKGNRYFSFTKSSFSLGDGNGNSMTLEGEGLTDLIGKGMMLPNSTRTFKMQPPEGFAASESRIEISVLE